MSTGAPVIAVQNMPPEYLEKFNASRAYIVNITDTDYCLSRTYGNYQIPGRKADEDFTVTEIGPRKGTMDMGDRKVFDFPITPGDVAADLCREINTDAGFDSFLGVFVCKANVPTEAELNKANKRLEKFYTWCIAQGDSEWQRSGSVIMIPDLFKRAVTYLKLDREWCSQIQPNLECPGCGTHLRPKVAICAACGCVIDRDRAEKLGLIPQRSVEAAPEPTVEDMTRNLAPQLAGPVTNKGKKKS